MTTLEVIRRRRDLRPDAVAVSGPEGGLTYAELLERVDRLSATLRRLGVRPGAHIGLCLRRNPGMVVALLAVWAAGGAYVPLDPAFPAERLRLMREDAAADLVLTQPGVDRRLLDGVPRVLTILEDGTVPGADPAAEPPATGVSPAALAYLIYTSGSTGRPKGVAVPHGAVGNLIESFASLLGPAEQDRWLAVTTLSFDISVLELLLPLACGAQVVIAPTSTVADGTALRELAIGATIMQATPQTWRLLLEAGGVPETITTRLCGGEALPRDLADALLADGARLWNVYGPTETTVWSSAGLVAPAPAPVDLGEPIGRTRLYVLDADGDPVPAGKTGELHIGGAGLARGYHGLPAMTADRFRPDPFAGVPGARMYATGDLVRADSEGRLEYLGRGDQQVKIQGHRIELGEIEAVLRAAAGVRQAAVGVHPGADGLPRLIAYVVPADDATVIWPMLRARLRARLPGYMIPAGLVVLDRLPLTPNGKLDRAALPPPDRAAARAVAYRAAETPVEKELAAIWAEVLGLGEPVGVDDDFFDLGGHSLTATKILARMRARMSVSLPLAALFEHPTVAGLAQRLAHRDERGLDLAEMAALRVQFDGLSAEELAAIFDEPMADR
ncbi:amino acid adenylation domain-containing protein [Thermocatellispora tengchongensis]|uniref:Amino acid adenylation domain-containing protein n=1 Tax=Thermocatellispora tengchongensis TaxID=1073253 RepID=A0A840PI01_9ACTN|nr:non-ribosomal peptide synthetase [Thermocatellispora tengchongensis]MBB5136747.1 amino acid adenylation domain-containing protein [Thermocatellispora tengchongensis]